MNILMYVMTMLMIMAMLTYARLEVYRNYTGLHAQFVYYMTVLERQQMNNTEISWYDRKHTQMTTQKPTATKQQRSPTMSKLSIYTLINKEAREKDPNVYNEITNLLKRLIALLYGNQKFFIEMESQHPNFLDELISNITHASENLPEGIKITSVGDLANLDLGSLPLNTVFYKMMRGTPPPPNQTAKPVEATELEQIKNKDSEAVTFESTPVIQTEQQAQAYSMGYPPLGDFLTAKNSPGIRIFLASRPLLLAVFGDPGTVESIIAARKALYQQVNSENITAAEATNEFKGQFGGNKAFPGDESFLDWTVTKTNPKNYE